MTTSSADPIAVVGAAAIMPQAPNAQIFWENLKKGVYSITDVPPERWDPAIYYDPDHAAVDKTYSRIGGWVREFEWNPIAWRLPVPPKVAEQMDQGQRWAVSAARAALSDAGYPDWKVDGDRVAVIFGNAIGGEKHYESSMRIRLPEMLGRLQQSPTVQSLPADVQRRIVDETRSLYRESTFDITEDTMPGELSNVMAGRVANLFNLRGPNFTTDAACASALAAIGNAVLGLRERRFDAVVCGGIDRNMGVDAFVKFCKIGALSATGTRPFDAGADGFVMGEGAAVFVLRRLEDAERDGDRVYATILGIAGSSDGKGKGITAPNPVGQQLAVRRAWEDCGEDMATVGAIEAHGTSTRVGDAAELASLSEVFGSAGLSAGSVALGSVKSNIGHLKAAAGAAGLFKMIRSLHEKVLVPSLNFVDPNPGVDWDTSAFAVNTTLRPWPQPPAGIRRAGVSAFGFGGTNFHVVLEEHVPGRHRPQPRVHASARMPSSATLLGSSADTANSPATPPATPTILDVRPGGGGRRPLRGTLVLGAADDAEMVTRLTEVRDAARGGRAPLSAPPERAVGQSPVRVAVDYGDADELAGKLEKVITALQTGNAAILKMMRQQGAFVGRGPAPKVAFLYTGQGSQYVNMLRDLAARVSIVGETFAEADRVMTPLLGKPLTDFIFVDPADEAAVRTATQQLMQTEITQPAVLATDLALTRLLAAYGMKPDMVMGHSLGEYGALVAAGALTFEASLEAVSARGREMAHLSVEDNGAMAAVFGPLQSIQEMVADADGYAVVANINSYSQAVVGGATDAVERLIERFTAAGMTATRIPVSHAFHTSIVAPASVPFGDALRRLDMRPPTLPIVANVTGEFYPADATKETMLDYAGRQIASPVQFVKGLETLYAAGARIFVEVGPKKALHGFVEDVLASRHDDVLALFTNHPKIADEVGVNQALCGLWAAGIGFSDPSTHAASETTPATMQHDPITLPEVEVSDETITELGRLFAGVLEQGMRLYRQDSGPAPSHSATAGAAGAPRPVATAAAPEPGAALATTAPVVITGAALGLPGVERTFDDDNVARILAGQSFIGSLPQEVRDRMVDMRITRIVKDATTGGGSFVTIDDAADVIKLAAWHAPLDMVEQFAVDRARDEALDNTTRLAIGAGFDAMRDAGIPLTRRYKTTTIGSQLPDTWGLPEALRDDTGVIFASAFPGYDRFAEAIEEYAFDRARRENLAALRAVRATMSDASEGVGEVDRLIAELAADVEDNPYRFDRRFLFRTLAMGHSQFAEIIGARGPNTQINAACASTTQALSVAEDWIRSGRAKRVIVVSADDATSPHLLPWVTAGFLATGAAATDEHVEDAATPFDRRRHGMIVGMGAAAFVVESAESARERGLSPIVEVLASITANSAFHGTRLDVEHIGGVMESLIVQAERRGIKRHEIAGQTMFMSHETYTPARGGSAAAEINALRRVFGEHAAEVVITNTKGFTGHAMGAGMEDVVAIKALETGIVPPVPNYREPDPDLGRLNLSTGGRYDVEYALRLAAGFGSQIAMALLRRTPLPGGARRAPDQLGYAYRIIDRHAWQHWLDGLSGHSSSTLEVDHRRLRITDVGAPAVPVTPVTQVPVPYPGIAGAASTRRATSPIAPTIDFPKPFDHAAGVAGSPALTPTAPPRPADPAQTSAAPPAAPVEEPPAPAAPAPGSAAGGDPVLAKVADIVAEMTGYPVDLLDPDLDLEADLGVDTVKQAEVFAAVRQEYGVERDATLQLRDFPTLNHVAGWIRDKTGLPA
ncbi:acyltransferase domain-containing protein, partial [Nostocoides sp. F2B08]|uniref:type I polyketide synthase n=1 Tax=Nostocoides sp. F2B08 TaxID=2653936 RepID=UPI0012630DE1